MMTDISPAQTITLAKIRHIEELERLDSSITFVERIGQLIHQIQAERGASCLYLASSGKRFSQARADIVVQNQHIETDFRQALQQYLDRHALTDAKQLTLISWILLGLDQLKNLRHQITLLKISFADCIESYNRFIQSLISLIFEITDSSVNSKVSTSLLTLYNLVQAKEFAGQERAVGSYLFGSGSMQSEHQQKLLELITQQNRHFELFSQFGTQELQQAWAVLQSSRLQQQHEHLRHQLTVAKDQQILNTSASDTWFALCSERLSEIWLIQCQLVQSMHRMLAELSAHAKKDLAQTKQYLEAMTQSADPNHPLDSSFFNLSIPVESALQFQANEARHTAPVTSIMQLLQQQSQQIAEMEITLADTKKALSERKVIERAKGLLMRKFDIDEMEAYKQLRSTAMTQNRKIVDIAENILAQTHLSRD